MPLGESLTRIMRTTVANVYELDSNPITTATSYASGPSGAVTTMSVLDPTGMTAVTR